MRIKKPSVLQNPNLKRSAELEQRAEALEGDGDGPHAAGLLLLEDEERGVRRGLANRATIAPYRIPGPVSLTLLDSANHCEPFAEQCQKVTCDTITDAFNACEESMAWCSRNTTLPDGFVFPQF